MNKKLVSVTRFDIYISFAQKPSDVKLSCSNHEDVAFVADVPVDFVKDVLALYKSEYFDFMNCTVRFIIPATDVDSRARDSLPKIEGFCVAYEGPFLEAISVSIYSIPIYQYCYRKMLAYINACAFVKTIQDSETK